MPAEDVDLRYPTGKFTFDPADAGSERRREWIARIAATPARLRAVVDELTDEQLDTPYRPGGWTVRQVAHHLPDSHLNAYTRLKLALTEDHPLIKPYDEDAWAGLADTREVPVEVSLVLLEALHRRWVALWESLTEEQWARTLRHPEMGDFTLPRLAALYAWHGDHHVAHVAGLRERMGW